MSKQVPKETFNSPEHQAWLKIRKEQDPLNPQPIQDDMGVDKDGRIVTSEMLEYQGRRN